MLARVMVVEDAALVRTQIHRALALAGFGVREAFDGQDAWEKLSADPHVDLVICDVNMPRMNGIELIERMSQDSVLRSIPVLVLTTEGQPERIQMARALGVKGWIIKPFKAPLLVTSVQRIVTAMAAVSP